MTLRASVSHGKLAEETCKACKEEETISARGVKKSSDSGVELEQAAESVATADGTALGT